MAENVTTRIVIIDRQTGGVVGTYKDNGKTAMRRARTRVDKLDNAYGGYRYFAKRENL